MTALPRREQRLDLAGRRVLRALQRDDLWEPPLDLELHRAVRYLAVHGAAERVGRRYRLTRLGTQIAQALQLPANDEEG